MPTDRSTAAPVSLLQALGICKPDCPGYTPSDTPRHPDTHAPDCPIRLAWQQDARKANRGS